MSDCNEVLIFESVSIFFSELCLANQPPIFVQDMNNLVISENTPLGSVIFVLQGHDPENSTVHYNIQGTDALRVDRETGEVTVARTLDYEVLFSFLST